VHGGPGSGNDVFARALTIIIDQEKLLPVRMQVVNKPGGGSTTAAAYVVSKKGDQQVIACFTNVWLVDPLVQEAANNKLVDMSPIARLVVEPALVVVRADSPFKTLPDFINAAKEKPGALKMSGGSITSRENLIRQLLMKATGARWAFISFPSGGERIAALLGGHVDMMIIDPSEAGEQVRAGKLRMIAQVNERRLSDFPDVPTIREAGYNIPNVPQMRGVVGAPGMSAEAVVYYEDIFQKASKTPAWQKFLTESQLDGEFVKAAELKAFLTKFEGELREILKEAGAKVVR
jgi:putative tricarboxylic transport membrane protein